MRSVLHHTKTLFVGNIQWGRGLYHIVVNTHIKRLFVENKALAAIYCNEECQYGVFIYGIYGILVYGTIVSNYGKHTHTKRLFVGNKALAATRSVLHHIMVNTHIRRLFVGNLQWGVSTTYIPSLLVSALPHPTKRIYFNIFITMMKILVVVQFLLLHIWHIWPPS